MPDRGINSGRMGFCWTGELVYYHQTGNEERLPKLKNFQENLSKFNESKGNIFSTISLLLVIRRALEDKKNTIYLAGPSTAVIPELDNERAP